MEAKRYEIPSAHRITLTGETRRLYDLEEPARHALIDAARELCRVVGWSEAEFWTRSVPYALYTLLDGFELGASEAAAKGFLADQLKRQEREG